jgi:hypothetical protein
MVPPSASFLPEKFYGTEKMDLFWDTPDELIPKTPQEIENWARMIEMDYKNVNPVLLRLQITQAVNKRRAAHRNIRDLKGLTKT